MPNKENILKLAEIIEGQPHVVDDWSEEVTGFNLNRFWHFCGTPSCIGGWAAAQALQEKGAKPHRYSLWHTGKRTEGGLLTTLELAQAWLGISETEACELFTPSKLVLGRIYHSILPAEAAKVLRHLAETGKVDWSIIQ